MIRQINRVPPDCANHSNISSTEPGHSGPSCHVLSYYILVNRIHDRASHRSHFLLCYYVNIYRYKYRYVYNNIPWLILSTPCHLPHSQTFTQVNIFKISTSDDVIGVKKYFVKLIVLLHGLCHHDCGFRERVTVDEQRRRGGYSAAAERRD